MRACVRVRVRACVCVCGCRCVVYADACLSVCLSIYLLCSYDLQGSARHSSRCSCCSRSVSLLPSRSEFEGEDGLASLFHTSRRPVAAGALTLEPTHATLATLSTTGSDEFITQSAEFTLDKNGFMVPID